MGQVFVPDKISDLSITGAKTVELPSSTITIGGQQYRNSIAVSLDLTTSGAAGLDTGSVAPNTTYYVYAILNAGLVSIVASLDPDTAGPTGFTSWKIVGALETDAASDVDFVYDISKSPGNPFSFEAPGIATTVKSGLVKKIEEGSNSNGKFVKFEDGTMICTHSVVVTSGTSFNGTWTYPETFYVSTENRRTGNAEIQKFVNGTGEYDGETITNGRTVSNFYMRSPSSSSTSAEYNVTFSGAIAGGREADINLMAIGRWKA